MGQASSQTLPPQPPLASTATTSPPPGCPMHQKVDPQPAKCPVQHDSSASRPTSSASKEKPAQCPVQHDSSSLNPLNNIPSLSQTPAAHQILDLPTERTSSTIPRPEQEGAGQTWEYPSPQQFYNALVRKGFETPEDSVEEMVQIHNFLNEKAWEEVMKWEKKNDNSVELELARFRGRPGELSPKARLFLFAGWLLPSRFNTEPPFDRHDWIVRRRTTGEEVRYVIDYYSAPPEPDGSPVFSLDVRPALDSVGSVKQRIVAATEDAWSTFKSSN